MPEELDKLIIDEEELNKSLLAETLAPYIGIGKASNAVILKPDFTKLNVKQKILVYLLARKALVVMGRLENEPLGPKELSKNTNIKEGSVYPIIRALEEEGLLTNDKGRYLIPDHNLIRIKEMLR